jgi:DNA topoisomerase-1
MKSEERWVLPYRGGLMGECTLIVAEKPTAAERIAKSLDNAERPERREEDGVPYFVAERDRKIIVVSALGHLYVVGQGKGVKNRYPVFDFAWAPRFQVERGAQRIKAWIDTISMLASEADTFIDACDYDVEGCVIGYNIMNYACDRASVAKRMKYSTLTKNDLVRAYENLLPTLDFGLVEAGRARHEVDWLYGINLSRALTLAAKRASGGYVALSTGRVQGPTLRFLVLREDSIGCFVPTPFWTIRVQVAIRGSAYQAQYHKSVVETRAEAHAIIEACKEKPGVISTIKERNFKQGPPPPFDLGTLQSEAYRLFRFNPKRTSDMAERLYLEALISYPRTSSQKLPPAINYRAILSRLSRSSKYQEFSSELLRHERLKPKEGGREDSAHPAIYPTGNLPERKLKTSERKLWDLIVKRFMAVFGDPAKKQNLTIEIDVNGHRFFLSGRKILEKGWLRFYRPYIRFDEVLLPNVTIGDEVKADRVVCENRFTKPPPRYNPASLLKKMEKERIGTKATRAEIIQTLYNRKYIRERSMKVTELGRTVAELLENLAPTVASTQLTRELEEGMQRIQDSEESRERILEKAIAQLKPALRQLKSNEEIVGKVLSEAVRQSKLQERTIGTCPTCKTGNLRSRRTGKRFAGCTGYFEGRCETSFPLPQLGAVKPTRTDCRSCGWPTLMVFKKGKRPWRLCLNPTCTRKSRKRKTAWRNVKSAVGKQ